MDAITREQETHVGALDFQMIGCIYCRSHQQPMPYTLPPPFASIDARDDVRLHDFCYWVVVNDLRRSLRLEPINPSSIGR